jgi:DNA-binding MarR family transcriptional regulator
VAKPRASPRRDRATARKVGVPDSSAPLILYPVPGYLARRFQQICAAIITESLTSEGLTQLQLGVLACLDDIPGIDQRRLAESLGIVPVNAGQIVDQLETMGLVDRRMNGADRRARELRLTPKGEKLRRRLHSDNLATNERILAPLAPPERRLLLDLLARVIEGNAAYARPGAGRRPRNSRRSPSNET